MHRKSKRSAFLEIDIFCNTLNVFTITVDEMNASFPNKMKKRICRCGNILGVTVCTEKDQLHIDLCTRLKKKQKREKVKRCQLPPKAGYM